MSRQTSRGMYQQQAQQTTFPNLLVVSKKVFQRNIYPYHKKSLQEYIAALNQFMG